MIFHPVEEAVSVWSAHTSLGVYRVIIMQVVEGGRCHSSWFRQPALPDGTVVCVSVSGTNAANHCSHSRIFRNFPLVDWRDEGWRLVYIPHHDLDGRAVLELLQRQKPCVDVIINGLYSHFVPSFGFVVQRL